MPGDRFEFRATDQDGNTHRANRPGRRPVGFDARVELPGSGFTGVVHFEAAHKAILVEAWPHDVATGPTVVYIPG